MRLVRRWTADGRDQREQASGAVPRVGVAVAVVAGVVLAGAAVLARRRIPRVRLYLRRYRRRPAHVEQPALLVNPRSGDGCAERVGLVGRARDLGIDVTVCEPGQDFAELAAAAIARGADALGMAGGDGSLGAVAGVAIAHDLPFYVVPAGTRNHFAMDLGLDREDPLAALAAVDGDEILIDYGLVEGRVFLNTLSLGLYAEAVEQPEYREHKASTLMDTFRTALDDPARRPDLRFQTPDGTRHESAALVLLSNNPYAWSGPPDFAHRVRLDRGALGVVAAAEHDPARPGAHHLGHGLGLYDFEAPAFDIGAESGSIPAGVDGESVALSAPATAVVVRRGLRVLVPAGVKPGWLAPAGRMAAEITHAVEVVRRHDH